MAYAFRVSIFKDYTYNYTLEKVCAKAQLSNGKVIDQITKGTIIYRLINRLINQYCGK